MILAVIPSSDQLLTPKQFQGESIFLRRRLPLFVRPKVLLQSSYDLLNNHSV